MDWGPTVVCVCVLGVGARSWCQDSWGRVVVWILSSSYFHSLLANVEP